MSDHYQALRVHPDDTHDVIRSAFRSLAWIHHPDRGGDPRTMRRIAEAWAVLGRPDRRDAYDQGRAVLAAHGSAHGGGSGPTKDRSLDYGRYQGWTIEALARHDPDYLEWLARSQAGRSWRRQIDIVLRERALAAQAVAPQPAQASGRWRWRS